MDLNIYLQRATDHMLAWQERWGVFERHSSLAVEAERLQDALAVYLERLEGNYPFFHPRYAGQMLKPSHPAAIVGYLAAMLVNPNNHALDGGPPTGQMEKEVVRDLAAMFGFPDETLGHLTSSGTIANLEALWVAREVQPGKAIAFSEAAHYTHSRMAQVLGVETTVLPTDAQGRMQLEALEDQLATGQIGTVVLTAGTTALGVVDPIEDAHSLCKRYDCRVHVDAAYGGFFTLLAGAELDAPLTDETRRHFRAIAGCDSVVVDPHKHGLQPYGCGCVLFRDPSVGRFYKHDSPYTYFTSDELHLGEISLECSRAGAAAGALWFTLKVLPLRADDGLGPILAACLRAARAWHDRLEASKVMAPYVVPELDIVTYFPLQKTTGAIDAASQQIFERAMRDAEDPVFLSVLRVESETVQGRVPSVVVDQPHTRILRSVLMKPEQEHFVDDLHGRVEELARNQVPSAVREVGR